MSSLIAGDFIGFVLENQVLMFPNCGDVSTLPYPVQGEKITIRWKQVKGEHWKDSIEMAIFMKMRAYRPNLALFVEWNNSTLKCTNDTGVQIANYYNLL